METGLHRDVGHPHAGTHAQKQGMMLTFIHTKKQQRGSSITELSQLVGTVYVAYFYGFTYE